MNSSKSLMQFWLYNLYDYVSVNIWSIGPVQLAAVFYRLLDLYTPKFP